MRRLRIIAAGSLVAAVGAAAAFAASDVKTGPSSSQSPYVVPVDSMPAGISTRSILTVGDTPQGSSYQMVGIPDGLGAYDNGDGTFTLLMNHELSSSEGATRAHGAKGAFVSRWTIEKDSLKVVSGSDLIQQTYTADSAGAYTAATVAFNRFCSADLPAVAAFWNASSGNGYDGRIFMNGEEAGAEGRAFANVVTGSDAGKSYELPSLGRFSWENAVAHPDPGDRTIVVGLDDSSPSSGTPNNGQVYVYAGDKSATGSPVKRAGLADGKLYGIQVLAGSGGAGLGTEVSKTDWAAGNTFRFATVDVSSDRKNGSGAWSGAQLQTQSVAKGVTGFQRPEDGAWDPTNPRDFYFVTTSSLTSTGSFGRDGHTRLWRLRFDDPTDPSRGGSIRLMIDGPASTTVSAFTPGPHMFDNLTVSRSGQILLQEDPGGNEYLAKQWLYDIASDRLVQIAQHDPARFLTGAPGFLTNDEESSGAIDVSDVLGQGWYLFDDQAHYSTNVPANLVEGGQLLAFHIPPGKLGKLFG